jgi:hypothetical protein
LRSSSFTFGWYGGQPEWGRNLESAQLVGAELEKAVNEATAKLEKEPNAEVVGSLWLFKQKGSGVLSPKPLDINMFFGCGGRI